MIAQLRESWFAIWPLVPLLGMARGERVVRRYRLSA